MINLYLKSSLDRFIGVNALAREEETKKFKIQFGQIYRIVKINYQRQLDKFKIQFGQIYRQGNLYYTFNFPRFKIQFGQIYSVHAE